MPGKTLSISETFMGGRRVFVNERLRLNTDGRRLVSISGLFDPILALQKVMGSNWRVRPILETWYARPKKRVEVYDLGDLLVWRVREEAPLCVELIYVLNERENLIPAIIDMGLTALQVKNLQRAGFQTFMFEELIPT